MRVWAVMLVTLIACGGSRAREHTDSKAGSTAWTDTPDAGWPDAAGFDSDGDGIADLNDECPDEPETQNGVDDTDGCPDDRMVITDTKIEILDSIIFEHGRIDLPPAAKPMLDAIASTLRGNTDIKVVEVQGHAREDEPGAKALAVRRAQVVAAALKALGVPTAVTFRGAEVSAKHVAPSRSRTVEYLILRRGP